MKNNFTTTLFLLQFPFCLSCSFCEFLKPAFDVVWLHHHRLTLKASAKCQVCDVTVQPHQKLAFWACQASRGGEPRDQTRGQAHGARTCGRTKDLGQGWTSDVQTLITEDLGRQDRTRNRKEMTGWTDKRTGTGDTHVRTTKIETWTPVWTTGGMD